MSLLVVMGSGETAPTMVRVHRDVLAASGPGPAVLLDTPFAFQMNAEELVTRIRAYFHDSVGVDVEVASWPSRDVDDAAKERALALVGRSRWAFAGPGSPTYALRQWRDTALPATLAGVVRRGGTLVLGSAAAVTLGAYAVPVYEIYKVGEDPDWVGGLDLLDELTGLRAAVVPHFDNREGGTHDTRFCYLGEQRLSLLEGRLPDEVGVLGVDEHTAALVDVEARTLSVLGNGVVTVRRRGASTTFAAGAVVPLDEADALLRGTASGAPETVAAAPPVEDAAEPDPSPVAVSLREAADAAQAEFESAHRSGEVERCVAVALGLEQSIVDWSSDTLQSDDRDHARRTLRAMVVRLGELAEVGADPRGQIAPAVDLLLDLRAAARESGDFAASDQIRDRLAAVGVEVRDTPDGAEWSLHEPG